MKIYKNEYFFVAISSIIILILVIGSRILDLNHLSYANYNDVLKNYFTYLYYIDIQDGNILSFEGMNYPYKEHILYTDNTPILAILVKALGLGDYAIGIYNSFIISNYIIAPLIAYSISKSLNFTWPVRLVFSVFVVWMHPQQFNIYTSSNLSLSSILLLDFLLVILLFKSEKTKNTAIYISIALIIIIASFIHLYYLILSAYIFLPAFFVLLFQDYKKALLGIGSTLLGVLLVYSTIRLTDGNYALRPEGGLGFNYHLWRGQLFNFFKSYYILDLPFFSKHEKYHPDWFSFLGTAYPIIIVIAFFCIIKLNKSLFSFLRSNNILLTLLFVGTLATFTAIGNDIIIGKLKIFNFLNPLYLASFVTDLFNNFRFLSRFNFISFIAFTILGFYVLNYFVTKYNTTIAKGVTGLCLVIFLIDAYGIIKFQKERLLTDESIFTTKNLENVPLFEEEYDAFLPIPYYNVGSETMGYIIDDNNEWSNYTYKISIKNSLPLIASKLSRTPPSISIKMFSLFLEETDPSLIEKLKGKNIIIAYSLNHDAPHMNDEPAKTISINKDIFLKKWNPILLFTKDEVEYYEMTF